MYKMKKVISAIAIILVSISCYSQTEESNDKVDFGFNLGVNRTNILTSFTPNYFGPLVENKMGFDLGILMSYSPVNWLAVLPQAELSFNSSNISYYGGVGSDPLLLTTRDKVYPVSLGLKTHFHFILEKGKNNPYLILGPSLRFDLENEDEVSSTNFKSPLNFALDFGLGFDSKLDFFTFSPEMVYSYGVVNINPFVDGTYYHKLSLVLNFKD